MPPTMTNDETPDERGNDLEITVCRDGRHVNVRNAVSGTGEVHTVTLDDGAATGCTCPGHRFHGRCYHTGEVERRPLVVSAATAAASTPRVATDGGREVENSTGDGEDGENGTESGSESGETSRGTVDVHGCSTCGGYAYGDDDQCPECQQRGVSAVDETPL
jgi:rubrerythrin